MDIIFQTTKLKKDCTSIKRAQKRWGSKGGQLVLRRLDDLRAAETLEVMRLPGLGRCHELHGDRAGQLSLDLDHPYRLLFQPADDPVPRKPDGGLDWPRVTVVRILGVVDIHG